MNSLACGCEWQSRDSSVSMADFEAREGLLKDQSLDARIPFRQQERPHKETSCSGLQGHFLPSALWIGRASEDRIPRPVGGFSKLARGGSWPRILWPCREHGQNLLWLKAKARQSHAGTIVPH